MLEALDATAVAVRLWFGGQLISMIAVGTIAGLAFWMIGLPSPLALGIIAGITNFIPFIGPILGSAPALIFASSISGEAVLWTAAAVLAIQQLEGNIILPVVQRHAVSMPPALALLAILAFGLAVRVAWDCSGGAARGCGHGPRQKIVDSGDAWRGNPFAGREECQLITAREALGRSEGVDSTTSRQLSLHAGS